MNEFLEFFKKLFDSSDWLPRWHNGRWTAFHGWLYIISDLMIWSAYLALPLIILRFISRRSDVRFVKAYLLFAAFILACGSTHLLDAIIFWFPAYRLSALVRLITGVVSWATVFYTLRILPAALSLKTHAQLEYEIKDRERAEVELKLLNKQLNEAQDIAKMGHWQWDVLANKLSWSESMFKVYGFAPKSGLSYEDFINRVHPDDRNFVNEAVEEAMQTREFPSYVFRILLQDGSIKVIQAGGEVIVNEAGQVSAMIGTGQDITEQYLARQELLDKTHELEQANMELKKFAYIASHDLQEPLRKILTFASLLESESKEILPEKSKVYVEKLVRSSQRMQRLIEDILHFSKLKNSGEDFCQVNLEEVLDLVLADLEVRIEQTGARIFRDALPAIEAIPSQMGQLFQNLITNAIKFKKEDEPPVIHIRAGVVSGQELSKQENFESYLKSLSLHHRLWAKEKFLKICVQDNGIGFDQVYATKIFEIFQRLQNSRSEGTGIGLAICKKIVDNHYGFIGAHGRPGNGSDFQVLLPFSQKNFIK